MIKHVKCVSYRHVSRHNLLQWLYLSLINAFYFSVQSIPFSINIDDKWALTHVCVQTCTHGHTNQQITGTLLAAVTTHLSHICVWELSWAKGYSLLQSGLLTVFSFSLMESDGMGLGHLYLCPNSRDFCPKIALLSACLSCWARWESVKGISARWSVWLCGKTRC